MSTWRAASATIDYNSPCIFPPEDPCKRLLTIAAQNIIRDPRLTEFAAYLVPPELFLPLMEEALAIMDETAIKILLVNWPFTNLDVKALTSPCISLNMLYNKVVRTERLDRGSNFIVTLLSHLIDCVPIVPLKIKEYDFTGFPILDSALKLLVDFCLLLHSVEEERKLVTGNPDNESAVIIRVECVIQKASTFSEVSEGLEILYHRRFHVQLCIHTFLAMCLGSRVRELIEVLTLQDLHSLSLFWNSIGTNPMSWMQPAFARMVNLTALDLTYNKFTLLNQDELTKNLARALRNLPSLRRLDMSNNRLTGQLEELLSGLQLGLQFLKLIQCSLTARDVAYLSQSHHMQTMIELDMSNNCLYPYFKSMEQLFRNGGKSLIVLELEKCKFKTEQIQKLCSFISMLQCVKYLNLSFNMFERDDFYALIYQFSASPTLQVTKLSYPMCFLDEKGHVYVERANMFREDLLLTYRRKQSRPFHIIWPDEFLPNNVLA